MDGKLLLASYSPLMLRWPALLEPESKGVGSLELTLGHMLQFPIGSEKERLFVLGSQLKAEPEGFSGIRD